MPNSDGIGSVATLERCKSNESKKSPVVNGTHESGESKSLHGNGDAHSKLNGISLQYSTTELSSRSPLTMKIMRKRHSDSEMVHETLKKTKLNDTPRSEPSPLIVDTIHDPIAAQSENRNENTTDSQVSQDNTRVNDSPSSSVIVIDEDNDGSSESEPKSKRESANKKSKDSKTTKTKSNTLKINKERVQDFKAEVKEEVEILTDDKDSDTQNDTTKCRNSSLDERLLLRADVMGLLNDRIRRATTSAIIFLRQLTHNKTLESSNWQMKFQNIHNRFLHLRVSTDKMVENTTKDDKQFRSVEAQTEREEVEMTASNQTPIQTSNLNGMSPNPTTRLLPTRQLASTSPSKSSSVSTTAVTQQSVISNMTSTSALQAQLFQNTANESLALSQIVPSQMERQSIQPEQQQNIQEPTQPQPQQQFVLLQNNPPSNAHVVQINTNVIDLTDDDSSAMQVAPTSSIRSAVVANSSRGVIRQATPVLNEPSRVGNDSNRIHHPMPLPRMNGSNLIQTSCRGLPPPSPQLTVTRTDDGVCLQWSIPSYTPSIYSRIKRYRLFNYSKTSQSVFYTFQNPWKEIGSVESMDLPMACTLTQIQENSIYYFAIRPVDEYERLGTWSNTASIRMGTLDS